MSAFKPSGAVALIRVSDEHEPEIAIRGGYDKWYVAGPRLGSQHGWQESRIEIVRPLVVLDLERVYACHAERDPAAVVRHLRDSSSAVALAIADQIEQQTRPPKPPEPTGLGAVVEDAEGHTFLRQHDGGWLGAHSTLNYADIDAVRVLSEGVKP